MLRLAIPRRAPAVRSRGSRAQNTSGPGVRQPGSPAGKTSRRGQDLPRFPGNPRGPMPCSSTPAGPVAPRRSGTPIWPPCCPRRRLQRVVLSRLNRTALALTVYASSSPLRCRRRKTRFRWLARPCRVGLATHRVATKGFKDASSSPPLLSFSWRKDSLRKCELRKDFGTKGDAARLFAARSLIAQVTSQQEVAKTVTLASGIAALPWRQSRQQRAFRTTPRQSLNSTLTRSRMCCGGNSERNRRG